MKKILPALFRVWLFELMILAIWAGVVFKLWGFSVSWLIIFAAIAVGLFAAQLLYYSRFYRKAQEYLDTYEAEGYTEHTVEVFRRCFIDVKKPRAQDLCSLAGLYAVMDREQEALQIMNGIRPDQEKSLAFKIDYYTSYVSTMLANYLTVQASQGLSDGAQYIARLGTQASSYTTAWKLYTMRVFFQQGRFADGEQLFLSAFQPEDRNDASYANALATTAIGAALCGLPDKEELYTQMARKYLEGANEMKYPWMKGYYLEKLEKGLIKSRQRFEAMTFTDNLSPESSGDK